MKKPDRLLIMFAALVLAFGIAGCSDQANNKQDEVMVVTEQAEPEAEPEPEPAPELASEPESEPEPAAVGEHDETYIRPEFQQAMDDYEAFWREYVDCLKLYKENPTDAEVFLQYSELLAREADMIKSFEAWETKGLTTAELALYMEVHSRALAMLAEVM